MEHLNIDKKIKLKNKCRKSEMTPKSIGNESKINLICTTNLFKY